MSDISIRRKHGKRPADARAAAEHMTRELQDEFDLDCTWDGEVMHFKRSGVSGELTLDSENVSLCIALGFPLSAFKSSIEREVNRFFDENFPA